MCMTLMSTSCELDIYKVHYCELSYLNPKVTPLRVIMNISISPMMEIKMLAPDPIVRAEDVTWVLPKILLPYS